MRNLRVAVWQMEPRGADVDANLARLRTTLVDREVAKCDLLVGPEMFLTGFGTHAGPFAAADTGQLLQRVGAIVEEAGISLAASVLTERGGRHYNTFYLWGDDGEIVATQDKIHLWAQEANRATPGTSPRAFNTEWGRVGGMVCYDVEFPEVGRVLAIEGAELFLVPSAFYSPTSWDISTRARALENGCYLVAANQVGGDPANPHNGMSRIVDPFGNVVTEVPTGREGIATAALDGNLILKAREYAPFLRDRRLGVDAPQNPLAMPKAP